MNRIPNRYRRHFNKYGYFTADQLLGLSLEDILKMRGIGPKVIPHVNEIRSEAGLEPFKIPEPKYHLSPEHRAKISEGVRHRAAIDRTHRV